MRATVCLGTVARRFFTLALSKNLSMASLGMGGHMVKSTYTKAGLGKDRSVGDMVEMVWDRVNRVPSSSSLEEE